MSGQPAHPRARALRITYLLLALWFLILAALLGVLVGSGAGAILGVALFAPGLALGAVAGEHRGLVPAGSVARAERRLARVAVGLACLNAIAAIAWVASGHESVAVGAAVVGVALVCELVAFRPLLRSPAPD
jgi:hypothetical protein